MPNLKEIRKRIHSTESVRQITKAMEMVSAARFRRASDKAKASRPFAEKLKEMLGHMVKGEKVHPFFKHREVKKTTVVIVAGEKGLCGAYNANVLDHAFNFLQQYNPSQVDLVLIGAKAIEFFKGKGWTIRKEYNQMQGKFTFNDIKMISEELVHDYETGKLDAIWLIYTHFINTMTREVVDEKFLSLDDRTSENSAATGDYIYEPTQNSILERLIPLYCVSVLQKMLNEAWASELSSRVQAMRAATKNAEEMIESLTLIRNKVRQEGITREILEITSGAEGLKG